MARSSYLLGIFTLWSWLSSYGSASAERVRIVSSTTLYPIITAAAERFAYETEYLAPVVEATGSGGGIKVFCSGNHPRFPHIVASSRQMSTAEREYCSINGVEVYEIEFGYDGIVIAQDIHQQEFTLTLNELIRSLNNSEYIRPQLWNEIAIRLPSYTIKFLGPAPNSGTYEALEAIFKKQQQNFVIRKDKHYINASNQENILAQKISIERSAIGLFSYAFYQKNQDRLKAINIDGVYPTYNTIISGAYPLARVLYIYIKQYNIALVQPFIESLLTPETSGALGYLKDYGFIAFPFAKHRKVRHDTLQFLATKKTNRL